MKMLLSGCLCMLFAFHVNAQDIAKADYGQAARFTASRVQKMVHTLNVSPHWLKKGNKFWYQFENAKGKKWWLVDCDTKTKKPLFNEDKVIAKVSEIMHEPINAQNFLIDSIQFLEDKNSIRFQVKSQFEEEEKDTSDKKGNKTKNDKKTYYFQYDIAKDELIQLKDFIRAKRKYPWANISPDGKYIVYSKHYNLYWMDTSNYNKALKKEDDSTIVEHALTTDGEMFFSYGANNSNIGTDNVSIEKNKDKRIFAYVQWSPDSRYFAMIHSDERKVGKLWIVHNMDEPRPTLETYTYGMPGDTSMPQDHLLLFDMNNQTHREIDAGAYKDQNLSIQSKPLNENSIDDDYRVMIWSGNNDHFFVTRQDRPMKRIDMLDIDVNSSKAKSIIQERMNTSMEAQDLGVIDGGKELIEWSERTGWAQFYLYKGDGTLENAITSGNFHCNEIEKIDEKNRVLYFTANNKEDGENPYYMHLYSINFDGSNLHLLDKGNFDHKISMNDTKQFFVDNYSRVNTTPHSVLYDNSGHKILDLDSADLSALFAAGFKFPEPFTVKAADGITDLYGVMYKPYNFDSTKKYPLVEYVYPGPQTEAVNTSFTVPYLRTDRLAQIGLIVVTIGNRGGSPLRSKWYHNYGYGNLRDYGLADKKFAAEELADKYKFINIKKVGIYGHSGGGFMTAAAMFTYPDFFKAGISSSGNHDNRIYNSWWSEKHHGINEVVDKKGDTTFEYKISTNPEIAKNLKGHLMLTTGDIDDNVHPANTIRVANALIKAGKRFDIMILPDEKHHYEDKDEYFYWCLSDYFSEWLIGDFSHIQDTDITELQNDAPKN
ncbi:MAG: DPP IV N-terminal domain-containing protein [Arachidicoccus sp.]|nr:DPP IV N-terminal domain-containing protein [Arachidicoccus sp.]